MRITTTNRRKTWTQGLCVALAVSGSIQGLYAAENPDVDDPLIDLFVKKGFVTQDEAEKIKAEAALMRTNEMQMPSLPESKWKIGAGIKNVELFGDVRMRFEDREADDPSNGKIDLQRWRYAVRFGLRGEVYDNFYYGLRLETSANPRSPFVTFGTSAAGTPYQGPFGKSTAGIDVGQAYIGWHPWDWLNITVGKMPNPFYSTTMIWNLSLSPEGAAENLKYTVGEADFFATFGQFIYEDTNPNQASPAGGYFGGGVPDVNPGGVSSIYLLAWQLGMNYHLTKKASLKVAPVLYIYSGNGVNITPGTPGFSDVYVGQGAINPQVAGYSGYPGGYYDGFTANQTGVNNLMVLDIPFELNLNIFSRMSTRIFGDLAYNLDGAARAQAAYDAALAESQNTFTLPNGEIPPYFTRPISSPQTHDVKAYQIGFDIGSRDSLGLVNGSVSKKNAWELKTYWQHIEQYSLDPNLLDTDFFEGDENLQGIYMAVAYGFSDNIIGTFRFGHASRINNQLGTGGSGQDIPQMNPINSYDIYQVDLTFKF